VTEILDVVVVGAGQAGLVMGYHLAKQGKRFLIVDAGAEIGDAWRSHGSADVQSATGGTR
jgi:putative flavoprotein involved in K+ transport